jgi:hypothetical protein
LDASRCPESTLEFRGCCELRGLENSEGVGNSNGVGNSDGVGILIEHFTKDISMKPSLARAASNSFKLDETLYTLSSGGLFSCEVKDLRASSRRNVVCAEGILFDVSALTVLPSPVPFSNFAISPRTMERIVTLGESRPRIPAQSSFVYVSFESNSKLTKIERRAFFLCKSLRSICIPASAGATCTECFFQCLYGTVARRARRSGRSILPGG